MTPSAAAVLLLAFAFPQRRGGDALEGPGGSRFRCEMGGRTIEVGGLAVSYVERGSGPCVVFLHGLGGCVLDWRDQLAPVAAAGFRAVAIDLPGAGFSPALPRGDYRLAAVADHAAAAIRALCSGPVSLAGSSYGGLIAIVIAARHPDLVDRLVLVDAVAYRQAYPYFVPLFRIRAVPELVTPLLPVRLLIRMVLRGAVDDPACITEEVIEDYCREMVLPGRRQSIVEIVRALVREDADWVEGLIPNVRARTLVVWGERDPAVPLENGRRLQREIPGASLVVIPDCGHLPHVEKPETFRRALLEFLERR